MHLLTSLIQLSSSFRMYLLWNAGGASLSLWCLLVVMQVAPPDNRECFHQLLKGEDLSKLKVAAKIPPYPVTVSVLRMYDKRSLSLSAFHSCLTLARCEEE